MTAFPAGWRVRAGRDRGAGTQAALQGADLSERRQAAETLLARADAALYDAERCGKDRSKMAT